MKIAKTKKNATSRLRPTQLASMAALLAIGNGCDTSLGVINSTGLTDAGSFTGISSASILSPTSVKVTWNTSSSYKTYQVYSTFSPFPLGNTIFSSLTINGLAAASPYSFSVGGISNTTGSLDGLNQVIKLETWPQFKGLTSLIATSPVSLQATWNFNDSEGSPIDGPNFNVYVSANTAPTDFTTPTLSTNSTTIGITQLADGTAVAGNTTYYVVVRATYLDATHDFNVNALSVTTPSNISPIPTVATDAVIIGNTPTFTVSGGLASYKTTFKMITYPTGITGPTGSQNLGVVTGNSSFKVPTSLPIATGANTIIPTLTSQGSTLTLPAVNVVARTFKDQMVDFPAFYAVTGPSGVGQSPRGYQRLGTALAVGDFNCDGVQDLAVAAPYGNFDPIRYREVSDGAVYIYYGSVGGGLITSPAPSANATGTNPVLITRPKLLPTPAGTNFFGYTLTSGNLNGDTGTGGKACDDLVVGTQLEPGEVWVFFGSPSGIQYSGSPNDNVCTGTLCSPLRISPPAGSYALGPDFGGAGLAIGILHKTGGGGDTYRDLIVGAPYEQAVGKGRGAVYIFYGGPSGMNLINPPPFTTTGKYYTKIDAPLDASPLPPQFSFNFGLSVAAVDMDKDGLDDIVVGAPSNNNGTHCYGMGSIYYYASGSGANHVPATGFFNENTITNVMITDPVNIDAAGCYAYGRFGGNLANAGDLNGDGYMDLIVGEGTANQAGATSILTGPTVIYGGPGGPQTSHGCASQMDIIGNSSPACTANATASCGPAAGLAAGQCKTLKLPYKTATYPYNFLSEIVSGAGPEKDATVDGGQDVNGDGYADFIVGWPTNYSLSYGVFPNRADVFYGGPNGVISSRSKLAPLIFGARDNFGAGAVLGNFNGSPSFAGAAVSAPDNMTLNGAYGGAVAVYNGQSGGLGSNVSGYSKLLTPNSAKEGIKFGTAVPVGDVNGDGFTDIAVKITRPIVNRPNEGYFLYNQNDMIIFYGSANGIISSPTPVLTPIHPTDPLLVPWVTGGEASNFLFQGAVGDVNGDGFADVAASDGKTLYVYFGSTTGLQVSVAPIVPPTTGLNPMIVAKSDATSYSILDADPWYFGTGNQISFGDFNGDGYSDIIVAAANGLYLSAAPGSGAVVVIYGSANGPQTDGALVRTLAGGPDIVLTDPCTGTAPNLTCKAQLLPTQGDLYFGTGVTGLGDVNKDGFADALIASPNNATGGSTNGAGYLFYGSPTGLQTWNGSPAGLLIVPPLVTPGQTNRLLGRGGGFAAAGDVNGDGYADFMTGSMLENGSNGGAFLFYGCGNGMNNSVVTPNCPSTGVWGLPAPPDIALASTTNAYNGLATLVTNGPSCNSSGCSILFFYPTNVNIKPITNGYMGYYWGMWGGGVGDVNKDGFADVVIGAHDVLQPCTSSACTATYEAVGGAVLYTGSVAGLAVGQNVSRTPSCVGGVCTPYWVGPSMTNWGVPGTPAFYYYGYNSKSINGQNISDFNGDGLPDFMIPTLSFVNANQTTSFLGGMYFFQ